MKIHVYIDAISVDGTPGLFFTQYDNSCLPSHYLKIGELEYRCEKSNSELKEMFETHKKSIMTPTKEITKLKAELLVYEKNYQEAK